jgi:hypothetical protein
MSQANRIALQQFLNSRGAGLTVDGAVGPATRKAIWQMFAGATTPATPAEISSVAAQLGADSAQVRAVAAVESSGGGFLPSGHPKILFERHWLFRRIGRSLSASSVVGAFLAASAPGGYTLDADRDGINDSWEKLMEACAVDPVAAFESCSWGKFQIMGGHWKALGYPDVFRFAYSMVGGEWGHYKALAAFIQANRLAPALRRLGTDPAQNEAFAKGYNGAGFRKHEYHLKLARAMRRELAA